MGNFLTELNQKISLNEGIEGHRAILREIYRAGHISLQDLAYRTLLPIPVLSKIVNFLVEKKVLGRIPEGILYTEQGMQFCERELGFYGFGIQECDMCDSLPIFISPRWDDTLNRLENIFSNRPTVDTTLDQAFAEPETSLLRALFLYERGALEGKKIAFLGDDDYTSVAVAYLYLGFFPNAPKLIPDEVVVFDLDARILAGIESAIVFQNFAFFTQSWDYRTPISSRYLHKFDTIIIDPPYSLEGLKLVLSRSIGLLRQQPGAEIYLSFAHRSNEEMYKMQKLMIEMGISIAEIYPRFNIYEGGQILGNTTQIFRLITTSHQKPLIEPDERFMSPIYTGEVNPTIKIYYCTHCSKNIALGPSCDLNTIEELKENGCPYCHSNGPFELDEKIELNEEIDLKELRKEFGLE